MSSFGPISVGKVLITALGYWLCGQISSLYAIPPGFASPIWPAAGFAMLMALLWGRWMVVGVFVASLFLNVQFAQGSLFPLSQAWLTGAAIAAGSSLQTLIAVYGIHRFTCYPKLVSRTGDALLLGLLGGPFACLISATVGVTTLVTIGVIDGAAYWQNWLTWWVGDSIGVLIFAPIVLTLNIRHYRGASAKIVGFLSLYFSLIGLASAIFYFAKSHDEASTHNVFEERTKGYVTALEKQLDSAADNAQSVVAVFESFPAVDYDNFMRFSSSLYVHIPGTQALSWIPIVEHDQREAFESQLLDIHGVQPQFFRKNSAKQTVAVEAKDRYFPVYFIYPAETNKTAIGFDLSSHPGRKTALELAIASGNQVATEPIELVQEKGEQKAFLLFSPIKNHDGVTGFISMVYRINDLVIAALGEKLLSQYTVTIVDISAHDTTPLLGEAMAPSAAQYTYVIDFASRHWQISFEPNAAEMAKQQSWWVWFILVFTFVFVILLGLLFLLILSRNAAIEQEVDLKTLALSHALEQAKKSSQIKSAFLASMSHELRTPLNSIIGFSHRLSKTLQNKVEDRYLDYLDAINRNGHSLLIMINDILDLSKVEAGKLSVQKAMVELEPLVAHVVRGLLPAAEDAGVTLAVEPSPIAALPLDQQRFTQVLTNLVINAIKFSNRGQVSIRFRKKIVANNVGLEIEVHDTGVGIAEADLPKLFQRYEQLGDTFQGGEMGTGLGLALVRELVELHGGRVYVHSRLGEGSSFFAWFPLGESRDGVETTE